MIDRALVLNPSFALAWYWSGWLRLFAGQSELAIQHFENSVQLNPRGQQGQHLSGIGMAHFINRRFDAALAALRTSLEEVPAFAPTYRTPAACLAHMGRPDEARSIFNWLVSLAPVVHPNVDPFRNPEHGELFRSGRRLAAGAATSPRPAVTLRSSPTMWRGIRG